MDKPQMVGSTPTARSPHPDTAARRSRRPPNFDRVMSRRTAEGRRIDLYDNANTQEWRRHDRAVAVIVALVVIVFTALGVFLYAATSYR